MKIFGAGATRAIGRPLIAQLLTKGHDIVALTRSSEKAQALAHVRFHKEWHIFKFVAWHCKAYNSSRFSA